MIDIHYFAAARAARGAAQESVEAPETLADLLSDLGSRHTDVTAGGMTLSEIFDRCTFLVDGRSAESGASLVGATRVDILPPFAGG